MKSKKDCEVKISSQRGKAVDGAMFGIFFEDINYAADGGIMAEMIENRSFEFYNSAPAYEYGWSAVGKAEFSVSDKFPMNKNNTHCAYLSAKRQGGIKNKAYDGIFMKKGLYYNVSLFVRSEDYTGGIIISAEKDGEVFCECVLDVKPSGSWVKYEGKLLPRRDLDGGDFVIRLAKSGKIYLDMVSLVPSDAVLGLFRRDIAETLSDMRPAFVRFPGGCAVEGGRTLDDAYRWKETVGKPEERKLKKSRWQNGRAQYYCQSFNLGFYEYFLLCEYLGAKPVPVINAGLACMVNENPEAVPCYKNAEKTYLSASEEDLTDEFMSYIHDALDLVDFAESRDFCGNGWAKLRKEMGHEEPFDLEFIAIGNEQWERGDNKWHDRYYWFEHFLRKKKLEIKVISSAAWYHTGSEIHTNEYAFLRENLAQNPLFTYAADEHYYEDPSWFYENCDYYDKYPRDVNVFLGEVSARREKVPGDFTICTLENALAEAAYFTMLERNSDIVKMVSAAPLLCRVGGEKYSSWSPNLIWFDARSIFLTPSFFVQLMYAQNQGTVNLKSLSSGEIYENAVYDEETGELIIKAVNASDKKTTVRFEIDGEIHLKTMNASVTTLCGEMNGFNTMENPRKIAPETIFLSGLEKSFRISLPPRSFTVIRLGVRQQGYLMAHFVEDVKSIPKSDWEQVYFSLSSDGYEWQTLKMPYLRAERGEMGVRDPFLMRLEDGSFVLLATDLSTVRKGGWERAQRFGSKNIALWESRDLVNWSEERLVYAAPEGAGCVWAPKCVYHKGREMYMLFFASVTDKKPYHCIYRSFTKDFKSFTKPEIYIDKGFSVIDTVIVSSKNGFFRLMKDEAKKCILLEKSLAEGKFALDGEWEEVKNTLSDYTSQGSWEGPLAYKVNGTDIIRVMIDHYGGWSEEFPIETKGLTQFETRDAASGLFYASKPLSLPVKGGEKLIFKHGSVIGLTKEEYERLSEFV